MPSALGACEFFEKNASTINVAIYGIILYTSFGIGRLFNTGIAEYALANVFITPKKNAAMKILLLLHCPKINTANAKKPYPATLALKFVEVGTINTSPPIPAKTPEIITPA